MGEGGRDALRVDFDGSVKLEFHGSKLTSDGEQEGSAYNGHFACTYHHPSFCFNQFDDLERALPREGNVSSADDWPSVLEPIVARALAVRDLPDGRGGDSPMALSGHPRTHSAAQAAGTGAGMTAAHDETAAGCGGDGDGLPAGAPEARLKGVSGSITVRQRADEAREDLRPPRKSLANPRDEELLTFDAPGRSRASAMWKMSGKVCPTVFRCVRASVESPPWPGVAEVTRSAIGEGMTSLESRGDSQGFADIAMRASFRAIRRTLISLLPSPNHLFGGHKSAIA